MNDAQPNFVQSTQTEAGNVITAANVDLTPVSNARVGQQYLRPQAVKDTALGPIVTSSHTGLGNATFLATLIPTSRSANIDFTLVDNKNRTLLALPDVSIYTNTTSEITLANKWPNAFYGMSSMPITVMNDWGATDNVNVVTKVVIRNNLGFDVPVVVAIRWRIIAQSTNQFQSSTSATDFSGVAGVPTLGFGGH